MAFPVVPMVGAFFIDIVNALVIKLYLMLPIFAQQVCTAALKPPCSLGVGITFGFRHPALNQRLCLLRITFVNMTGNTLNFGDHGLIAQQISYFKFGVTRLARAQ